MSLDHAYFFLFFLRTFFPSLQLFPFQGVPAEDYNTPTDHGKNTKNSNLEILNSESAADSYSMVTFTIIFNFISGTSFSRSTCWYTNAK